MIIIARHIASAGVIELTRVSHTIWLLFGGCAPSCFCNTGWLTRPCGAFPGRQRGTGLVHLNRQIRTHSSLAARQHAKTK
eukprot:5992726-Amphidinium_carterae.1